MQLNIAIYSRKNIPDWCLCSVELLQDGRGAIPPAGMDASHVCATSVAGGHDARVVSRVDPCRYCPGNCRRSTTLVGRERLQEKEGYIKAVLLILYVQGEREGKTSVSVHAACIKALSV